MSALYTVAERMADLVGRHRDELIGAWHFQVPAWVMTEATADQPILRGHPLYLFGYPARENAELPDDAMLLVRPT